MRITLNPEYEALRQFAGSLPRNFENGGTVVQDRRNTIKIFDIGGYCVNVKRYRRPVWINRVAYTFFRKPKSVRAYENAMRLRDKGFDTPAPVAHMEEYGHGLLSSSYFLSMQLKNVREIREYYHAKGKDAEPVLRAFARFSAALHESGILHLDYSPGNILITDGNGGPHFSLVDINRMKFTDVDMKAGCANFARLFEYDETIAVIAGEYAAARGMPVEKCLGFMLEYKHRFERRKLRKIRLKKILGIGGR